MIDPDEAPEIERILKEARAALPPEGPVVLTPEYLRAIELVEALPENRPGSDKSWTERAFRSCLDMVRNARLVR